MTDAPCWREPLILSHGLGDNVDTWDELIPLLGELRSVVTWELRGHGDAVPAVSADYSMEAGVSDLLRVIDGVGGPVHLIGHSLGGYLSLVVAVRRPELVHSLTLIASGPGYRDSSARDEWNRYVDRAVLRMPVPPEAAGLAHQESSEVIDGVADLAAPLLVIVGEKDTRFHPGTAFLARTVPGCAVRYIGGAGHFPQRTHAPDVASLVTEHLEACRTRS